MPTVTVSMRLTGSVPGSIKLFQEFIGIDFFNRFGNGNNGSAILPLAPFVLYGTARVRDELVAFRVNNEEASTALSAVPLNYLRVDPLVSEAVSADDQLIGLS